jgi:hypothetical protein
MGKTNTLKAKSHMIGILVTSQLGIKTEGQKQVIHMSKDIIS